MFPSQKPNTVFSSILHQWYDFFIYPLGANIGTTRKTITVTEQQDKWIKAQIDGGDSDLPPIVVPPVMLVLQPSGAGA